MPQGQRFVKVVFNNQTVEYELVIQHFFQWIISRRYIYFRNRRYLRISKFIFINDWSHKQVTLTAFNSVLNEV